MSSDDILICLVNSDDLNDDFNPDDPTEDYNTCICPTENRPYKAKNAVWSLQKAVEFIFHQALDKSMTLNIWSCGLDLYLHTWRKEEDKRTRQSLVSYAINDLFASTNLYFHFHTSDSSSRNITNTTCLNNIHQNPVYHLPLFFLLSDSHGKYFPPTISTSKYKFTCKSISGLQWVNNYNKQLCTRSLLLSSSISAVLSTCNGVLFIVGTNSIRTTTALHIIRQIDDIIDLVRFHHPHLICKTDISIVSVFPCLKPSSLFPSNSLLLSNLNYYNNLLKALAIRKTFTVVDLHITSDHLNSDGMHVQVEHLPFLYNSIRQYLDELVEQRTNSTHSHRRSRIAITRRNRKRHENQQR